MMDDLAVWEDVATQLSTTMPLTRSVAREWVLILRERLTPDEVLRTAATCHAAGIRPIDVLSVLDCFAEGAHAVWTFEDSINRLRADPGLTLADLDRIKAGVLALAEIDPA